MLDIQSHTISTKGQPNMTNRLTCLYRNETEALQIIRISNYSCAFFEKVLLANQCVQFSTSCDAMLEIYEAGMCSSMQVDTIPCVQLAIATGIDSHPKPSYAQEFADLQGLQSLKGFLSKV